MSALIDEELWALADAYHNSHLLANHPPSLDAALGKSRSSGLEEIAVSPAHGKLRNLLIWTTDGNACSESAP